MREILFRGKSNYENVGEWEYGLVAQPHVTEDGIVTSYYFTKICENGRTSQRTVSANTVGQYTGLTDKNGNKIFEGDIVKARYRKQSDYALGMVIFENGTFKIKVLGTKKQREFEKYTDADVRAYAIENNFLNRGFNIEVIGNIHDNPELLKGGAE